MMVATNGVSITYFAKEDDENIYRSKSAECHHFQDKTVEYEEDDVEGSISLDFWFPKEL